MVVNKEVLRCGRCGKRLKKGGDNYRLACTVASHFDGYLDLAAVNREPTEVLSEIEESGLTEKELSEQVYFKIEQLLCFDCRREIVEFLKGKE
ncbi:MAG: hypothetical protein GX409_02870 [candidate division Zixibacteria bacterium]|jgi:hypothetical protein|nr:hypothetical protein [candidate division Zixibacteria bacterium]